MRQENTFNRTVVLNIYDKLNIKGQQNGFSVTIIEKLTEVN
jgi:hypothetical protein